MGILLGIMGCLYQDPMARRSRPDPEITEGEARHKKERKQKMATTHTITFEQNAKGEWDAVLKSTNGNLIYRTPQGYKNIGDAMEVIVNYHKAIANGTVEIIDPRETPPKQ